MIEFVAYLSLELDRAKSFDYNRSVRFLDMSIRVNQPGGILNLRRGKEKDLLFIERMKFLKERLEKNSGPIVMTDVDAMVVNRVDDLFEKDFSIAVPYRYKWEHHGGRHDLSTALLFFHSKYREKQIEYIDRWIECAKKERERLLNWNGDSWYYDQISLNKVLGFPKRKRSYEEYRDCVPFKDCKGKDNILFIDVFKWGCPHTMITPEDVRVLECQHSVWPESNVGVEKMAKTFRRIYASSH